MKKTRIIAMLLAILMVFAAVSCEEEPVHEHVYGKEWKSDATNHWHECECGEKADVAEHAFEVAKDGEELVKKCTVCGYRAEEKIENAVLVENETEFRESVKTAKVIYIGSDFVTSKPVSVNVADSIEINLNGKTITGTTTEGKGRTVFWIDGGSVKLSGKGTITVTEGIDDNSSVIFVGDNSGDDRIASLVVGEDIIVSSDYSYGICVMGTKTKETLVVDGTVKTKVAPAISGNGSNGYGDTKIIINGTVFTEEDNAIYHPQSGELVINGTVSGNGGIEMKAGSLKLGENAIVKGSSHTEHNSVNNNGCSTSGYAIVAVNNKNYATGVAIEIEKGTIDGVVAIVDDYDLSSETGKTPASIILSGGKYSVAPKSDFVKEGYEVKKLSESIWTVVAK